MRAQARYQQQDAAEYAAALTARLRAEHRQGRTPKVIVGIALVSGRPRAIKIGTKSARAFTSESFERIVGVYDHNADAKDMAETIDYCYNYLRSTGHLRVVGR